MSDRSQRQFGYTASLLLALGAWRLNGGGVYLLTAAAALAVITATFPRAWRPILALWMPVAHGLGWINTRLLLGMVFVVLIMPIGLILRLSGYDPLRLRAQRGTDWVVRGGRRTSSFKEPF